MIIVYKQGTFESAHQLDGHPKCGKLHGHSYKYEVWISAEQLKLPYEFVIDFHNISGYFKQFDHSDKVIKESCEQFVLLAVENFHKVMEQMTHRDYIIKVRIWETPTAYAELEQHFT